MQLNRLRGCHSVHGTHVSKVWTELTAVAHRDFHLPRLRKIHFFQSLEISPKNRFHFLMPQPKSIKLHQQRAISRMKIADAQHRLQIKQPQQLNDLLMGLESNLLPEDNQQRLIAGRLESRAFARRGEHARESIPHAPFQSEWRNAA